LTQFMLLRKNPAGTITVQLTKLPVVWAAGGGDEITTTNITTVGSALLTSALTLAAGTDYGCRTDAFAFPVLAVDDLLAINKTSGVNITGEVTIQILLTTDLP